MGARGQLTLIAVVLVLGMSVWLATSAIAPGLRADWGITRGEAGLLTAAVQLGFVAGALLSAAGNVPDLVYQPRLMAIGASCGAATTAALAVWSDGVATALPLRFATGFALASVYPVGMRLMASWFDRGRGLALGLLVGAVTLGSALPQLLNGVTTLPWRGVLLAASALALVAAAISATALRVGPHLTPSPPFAPGYVIRMFRDRSQRLVTLGYLGHMWELYAVWTWLPAYVTASLAASGVVGHHRALVGTTLFVAIGVAGAAGCLVAGRLADRHGRAEITAAAMATSGCCCLLAAWLFGAAPAVLVVLLLVWGPAAIADSAQFSAALTEVADPRYVGTALTAQMAIGFLLTIVTIQALPIAVSAVGWRAAVAMLAVGPLAGIVAMARFRTTRNSRAWAAPALHRSTDHRPTEAETP
jgi:MFS family permease